MPGLREQYKIREFQQARQALDSYYSALNTLARLIKSYASQEEKDEQVHMIREAKARLGRAIERLGFQVVDIEQDKVRISVEIDPILPEGTMKVVNPDGTIGILKNVKPDES